MAKPGSGLSSNTRAKECRRKVEAARRVIKDTEGLKYFAELERNQDPTRLRIVVKESEEQCNPDGDARRGKPRAGSFDILAYREEWESSTIADKGEKIVDKNEFEFLKFQTQEKGKTPSEVLAQSKSDVVVLRTTGQVGRAQLISQPLNHVLATRLCLMEVPRHWLTTAALPSGLLDHNL